jgi:AcrR family transcriptional regulator
MADKKSKPSRGRPKTIDRDAVLNLAMITIWQQGTEVSLNSICELARVAKPSLYREFGNEDGLASAALDLYFKLACGPLQDLFFGPFTFAKKLEILAAFICEDPRNQHGCLFVKLRAARSNLGPKTQARVDEFDNDMLTIYRGFLKQSRERGEWKSQLSDHTAANFLSAQVELAYLQRARGVQSSDVRSVLDIGLSALHAQFINE